MQVSPINCVEVVGVFLFTPCVTDDLFVVRYTVLLCGTIPFEEGYIKKKKKNLTCVCLLTPSFVLRFVYAGYCGVLGHCFDCTGERISNPINPAVLTVPVFAVCPLIKIVNKITGLR